MKIHHFVGFGVAICAMVIGINPNSTATSSYFLSNLPIFNSCVSVNAAETTYSMGENVTAVFDDATGTVTVSGSGPMMDFESYQYTSSDILSPFLRNSNVKKVVVEDGVTTIGEKAFYQCLNIEEVVIPSSVSKISKYAFSGEQNSPSKLKAINLHENMEIGSSAFYNTSFETLTIPQNVTLGEYAFQICHSLQSLTLGKDVQLGSSCFWECENLADITFEDGWVEIPELPSGTFTLDTNINKITFPDSIRKISKEALAKMSQNTSSAKGKTTIYFNFTSPKYVTINGDTGIYVYLDKKSSKYSFLQCFSGATGSETANPYSYLLPAGEIQFLSSGVVNEDIIIEETNLIDTKNGLVYADGNNYYTIAKVSADAVASNSILKIGGIDTDTVYSAVKIGDDLIEAPEGYYYYAVSIPYTSVRTSSLSSSGFRNILDFGYTLS